MNGEVVISWDGGTSSVKEQWLSGTESDLWQKVGKTLLNITPPNTLCVKTDRGDAKLNIGARGTFVKNGLKRPSMYVSTVYNSIQCAPSKYEERYLTCVNPEGNNYKFYRLLPQNVGDETEAIDAEYGSIDQDTCSPRHLKEPYESYLFWIRYYEKLSKGYEDMTKFRVVAKEQVSKKATKTGPRTNL